MRPVARAVVSHAHGDHARPGSGGYLAAAGSLPLLRHRLGSRAPLEGLAYGEPRRLGGTTVSFHPAGHILGSAQVRIERQGEVWVYSGDYKRQADPTCEPFAPVACDTFVTEATFAHPGFRWPETAAVVGEILAWWRENRAAGRASVLYAYAVGKAQRLLAELAARGVGRVFLHAALEAPTAVYRSAGILLPETPAVSKERGRGDRFGGELVLAPPSALGAPEMSRFRDAATAYASGWALAPRRRSGLGRGFVLSDHADWPALLQSIEETGACRVLVTHGADEERERLARFLQDERGREAAVLGKLVSPETGAAL